MYFSLCPLGTVIETRRFLGPWVAGLLLSRLDRMILEKQRYLFDYYTMASIVPFAIAMSKYEYPLWSVSSYCETEQVVHYPSYKISPEPAPTPACPATHHYP